MNFSPSPRKPNKKSKLTKNLQYILFFLIRHISLKNSFSQKNFSFVSFLSAFLLLILFNDSSTLAAPTRKDWCGTVWSVESLSTLAWISPTSGVTTSASGPTSQITMPGGSMGTSVAAIGIHKESGTMFAFDRTGTTGTLYKYKFGVDTTWQAVSISGLVGLSGTQTIAGASNNLNKMSVDGNTLFIAESNGIAVYSIPLDSAGAVIGNATPQTYSFSGDPIGSPLHSGTGGITGGDITTDEYGDTYNITYTSTTAYFYKQDPVARTWIYQGQTPATAAFAGAAFYKGDLFVKAGTQLKKVDLTRSGSGYTGWNNPLTNVGSPSSTSSADLTACGSPNITITKTQEIYTDAAATTLATDQTKVTMGRYIKYIITAKNTGDAWARVANLADNLPIGTSYIPNSATMNGTNLGLATYPFAGFPINSPGMPTGIIPFPPDPDTVTLTFVVQVTATSGSVQNRATITYVDGGGTPSETPICTGSTIINCGNTSPIIVENDYGDAPASYGTPSHTITIISGIRLGAINPDSETASQPSATANGDDSNGTDDEDAFTTLPNVSTAGSYSLRNIAVSNTATSSATLHAWVDFNKNGTFEATEYTSATVAPAATTASLNWANIPAGTTVGSSFVRFRITTQSLTDTTGTAVDERSTTNATDGEVEDYPVTIAVPIYDYGDAPDTGTGTGAGNYQTTASDGGAAQVKINVAGQILSLGSNVDTDDGNLQNIAADADDTSGTPNDEDGVSTFPTLNTTANQTYTVPVTVSNNVPLLSAYLVGYIDFNKDGDFLDAGERSATVTVPTSSTNPRTFNVTFTTPAGMTAGNTYARFRLGSVQATAESATGASVSTDNGEVEDYQVSITPTYDYGDAPDTYGTDKTANNSSNTSDPVGANHMIISGLFLGATSPDAETNGFVDGTDNNNNATDDDAPTGTGTGNGDDEDNFTLPTLTVGKTSYAIPASNITVTNITGQPATLHVWIDFNNNGKFDSTEYASALVNNSSSNPQTNLTWSGITVGTTGDTYARFRLTSDNSINNNTPGGAANNGEVEDYQIAIAIASDPNLLLVKRITAINPGQPDEIQFNNFVNDGPPTDDEAPNWPDSDSNPGNNINTYLGGAINVPGVKPGDEVEYTIYFLSNGDVEAKNIQICDVVPDNMTFNKNSYGTEVGIGLALNATTLPTIPNTNLSNLIDTDQGSFYAPGTNPPVVNLCQKHDPNPPNNLIPVDSSNNLSGAVLINLSNPLPAATSPGVPTNSYGFIRFRAKVK